MNKKGEMTRDQIVGFGLALTIMVLLLVYGGKGVAHAGEQREKLEPWMVHPECRCDLNNNNPGIICGQDGIYDGTITTKDGNAIDCSKYGSQTTES
jgi:hypothetical protein